MNHVLTQASLDSHPVSTEGPRHVRPSRAQALWVYLLALLAYLVLALSDLATASAAPVSLKVVSARAEPKAFGGSGVAKGAEVSQYKFLINIDNTGTTVQRSPAAGTGCNTGDPGYPDSCKWTSVSGAASSSPVYTQGNQADAGSLDLPAGRYLISVLAEGYKLDGRHFTVTAAGAVTWQGKGGSDPASEVKVEVQPTPLPDAQIQAAVFEDISPVNSAPDLPAEHGLAGFQAHITDTLGEVTTDVYGAPLCGTGRCLSKCYIVDGGVDKGEANPLDALGRCPTDIAGAVNGYTLYPGQTLSATAVVEGKVKIPNVGPNRYALSVTPPDGVGWIQTTTLEGNHDWDAWVMEGATGLDTEFVIAGEPFPAIIFGYVRATAELPATANAGSITGVVDAVKIYVPTTGGVGGLPGEIWGGMQGAVIDKPIPFPWVTLTDLGNGDTMIWAGKGDANGRFTINNVPPGNYTLTWWDEPQNTILDLVSVTVGAGETVDMGILPLAGWWTVFDGYVYNDLNRNGVKDPDEPGLPGYALTMRRRDNSLMDRGTTATITDATGYYKFEAAYPMTQWLVMEAYDNLHYTTGVTYQADNQPEPTTVLGAGVDVSVLPIIGLSGHMDWGKHVYDATGATGGLDPRNGGIVGTVSYDTTRNELDPRYAAVEDWQPSIPNLWVNLYAPVFCGTSTSCDATGRYALDTDGSFLKGPLLNHYLTETWQRPTGCTARGADKQPLVHGVDEQVLPLDDATAPCIEGPLMGVQFGTYPTPDGNFGAAVDGNYGFGDGCFVSTSPVVYGVFDPITETCTTGTLQTLPGGRDYLVHVDLNSQLDHLSRPIYKVTREEDINIANGDEFIPAALPPECAGALHTVDSTGNATFMGMGGSPYEGQQRPLCDVKLVRLSNGSSIAPSFNLYTDVPLPGRHWFIIIDDLNFSTNAQSITLGEKAGIPFIPVGIYDWTDRLITTVESDYNGLADVLLPSTNRINCPTPSGVCANVYRYVGNDPGVPGRLNLNYNPTYRTIAAEFEVLPGQIIPADLAPTQVGVTVQLPGAQNTSPIMCMLDNSTPQLYAVSDPFVNASSRNIIISGAGFGAGGTLTLGGIAIPATSISWTDSVITVNVPFSIPSGPQQLMITRADNGQHLVSGITIHVFASGSARTDNANTFDGRLVVDPLVNSGDVGATVTGTGIPTGTTITSVGGTGLQRYFIMSNPASATGSRSVTITKAHNVTVGLGANATAGHTATDSAINALDVLRTVTFSPNTNGLTGSRTILSVSGGSSFVFSPINLLGGGRNGGTADRVATITTTHTVVTFAANFVLDSSAVTSDVGSAVSGLGIASGATVTSVQTTPAALRGFTMSLPATANAYPGTVQVTLLNAGAVGPNDYNPMVFKVGPGQTYAPAETLPAAADHAIQRALDDAATWVATSSANSNQGALVVVYPNNPTENSRQNPRGAYYENLIITSRVKLQGVGPGSPDGAVRGAIIDGGAFAGDSPVAADWYTRILQETTADANGNAVPTWGGNPAINDGAVISVFVPPPSSGACTAAACRKAFPVAPGLNTAPSIDGFDLRGGNQAGFPGNINAIGGTPTGLPGGLTTQGGAVFANAYARNLRITNNVVQNNGGAYGNIRIGTPDLPAPYTNNENDGVVIANNRVISNAGTNLAGGIGLFTGADGYQVSGNDICGNFSSEYGGGISHLGLSPGGSIRNNRIYFNKSFDEGGGVMIAGALPADTTQVSPGAGAVDIYNNIIQANLSNDDGGGIRFLMAGTAPMNVYNNIIANNVSTHEGGGISLNDATNVRVYNNTIMKNLTTATAITSNGAAAPAGLASSQNSALLQATLPVGSPIFSNPVVFNNIFWDNRAGTRALTKVTGLGSDGDTTPIDLWDLGLADGTGVLAPTNSILQQTSTAARPYTDVGNLHSDPAVVQAIDIPVTFNTWRNNPAFLGAILISVDLPPNLLSDYHLAAGSPALNLGAATKTVVTGATAVTVTAPGFDIDNEVRPFNGGIDAGADEFGSTPLPPATVPAANATVGLLSTSIGSLSGGTLSLGNLAGAYNQVTLTLTATGGAVQFGAVTVSSNDGGRFSELNGGTCQDALVPAGGNCTVLVNFNASGNDQRRGTLTVKHSGSNSPWTLTLTGR